MKIPEIGLHEPEAGVMHTSPATAPEQAPRMLGLPRWIHSIPAQATVPAAAARCVATNAFAAKAFAARALPPLKPNQPTHSKAAPVHVYVRLCGGIGSWPCPSRFPSSRAQINAEMPELICTTVPPAKSNAGKDAAALAEFNQPLSAHTQCASGQ